MATPATEKMATPPVATGDAAETVADKLDLHQLCRCGKSGCQDGGCKRVRLGSIYIGAADVESHVVKMEDGTDFNEAAKELLAARKESEDWPSPAAQMLASQPRATFVQMLSIVCDRLTVLYGSPIETAPPLQNNATDQGWVAPWDNVQARRSLADTIAGEQAVGGVNAFSFNMLPDPDWDPDWGSVSEQKQYFFSRAKDVKATIYGSVDKTSVTTFCDAQYPLTKSIKLFNGGLIHLQALVVGIFECIVLRNSNPEEMNLWLRAVRSIVGHVTSTDGPGLRLLGYQQSEDLNKKADTEQLNSLEKLVLPLSWSSP